MHDVAIMYMKLSQHEQGLDWEMRALELRQAMFPGDSEDVANSYNTAGLGY